MVWIFLTEVNEVLRWKYQPAWLVYNMKFPMKEPDFVMENVAYDKALFHLLFRGRFRKRVHRWINDVLEWKVKK